MSGPQVDDLVAEWCVIFKPKVGYLSLEWRTDVSEYFLTAEGRMILRLQERCLMAEWRKILGLKRDPVTTEWRIIVDLASII